MTREQFELWIVEMDMWIDFYRELGRLTRKAGKEMEEFNRLANEAFEA